MVFFQKTIAYPEIKKGNIYLGKYCKVSLPNVYPSWIHGYFFQRYFSEIICTGSSWSLNLLDTQKNSPHSHGQSVIIHSWGCWCANRKIWNRTYSISYALLDRCLYILKIRDPNIDLAFVPNQSIPTCFRCLSWVYSLLPQKLCLGHSLLHKNHSWGIDVLTTNSDASMLPGSLGGCNSCNFPNGTKYFTDPVFISSQNCPGAMSQSLGPSN